MAVEAFGQSHISHQPRPRQTRQFGQCFRARAVPGSLPSCLDHCQDRSSHRFTQRVPGVDDLPKIVRNDQACSTRISSLGCNQRSNQRIVEAINHCSFRRFRRGVCGFITRRSKFNWLARQCRGTGLVHFSCDRRRFVRFRK